MNNLFAITRVAKVAMWIMISLFMLSFFFRSWWITIIWMATAVVCLFCTLMVGYISGDDLLLQTLLTLSQHVYSYQKLLMKTEFLSATFNRFH
jgi:hypothetical protein